MVNWTKFSQGLENTYKNDGKYDLPVPADVWDCKNLIEQMQDILGLFDSGEDALADFQEDHNADAVYLLRFLDPRDISVEEYPHKWDDGAKMWLFIDAVLDALLAYCRVHKHKETNDEIVQLQPVAVEYTVKLINRYEELAGKPYEEVA